MIVYHNIYLSINILIYSFIFLVRFFICCGIPFSTVNHPFFVDFTKSLCFGYNPPKRTTLSTTILNKEISSVLNKVNKELKNEYNLTLGIKLDGLLNIILSFHLYLIYIYLL